MPKHLVVPATITSDFFPKMFLDGRPRTLDCRPKRKAYGARVVPDVPDTEASLFGWKVYEGPLDPTCDWTEVGEPDWDKALAELWARVPEDAKARFRDIVLSEDESLANPQDSPGAADEDAVVEVSEGYFEDTELDVDTVAVEPEGVAEPEPWWEAEKASTLRQVWAHPAVYGEKPAPRTKAEMIPDLVAVIGNDRERFERLVAETESPVVVE